ncbi:C-C chemokine receptor type 8-like [Ornithorhynchus anatinus]|uniref:C-C chemokine receptor type 8-like n=1 Tax=Ornithorhynchus anatinus TaxID=9258 RepID=UPI0010A7F2C6|nr:C-C chemokine receptor type 8-like [Ornithorhynchus anatinus]
MMDVLGTPPDFATELNELLTTEDYYPDSEMSVCNREDSQKASSGPLAALYSLLFTAGLLGNVLVVLVLAVHKKQRSTTDVYLLNLAVADLLFVLCLPFLVHDYLDQWVFGNWMCKLVSGVHYLGFFSSVFFITLMSVDRYLAIVHAVYALKVRTASRGVGVSLAVWSLALLASTPAVFFYESFFEDGAWKCYLAPSEGSNRWKLFTNFEIHLLGLLIPPGILTYCYAHILRQLRRCQNHNREKAIRLVLVVVVAFFVFWTPFNVVLFLDSLHRLGKLGDCGVIQKLDRAIWTTEALCHSHCCVNPAIYAFVGERFRKHLAEMFRRFRCPLSACPDGRVLREPREGSQSLPSASSRSSGSDCIL